MPEIVLNGENKIIQTGNILALIQSLPNITPTQVVVELNENVIKRTEWPNTPLKDHDRLEVIRFVGGG